MYFQGKWSSKRYCCSWIARFCVTIDLSFQVSECFHASHCHSSVCICFYWTIFLSICSYQASDPCSPHKKKCFLSPFCMSWQRINDLVSVEGDVGCSHNYLDDFAIGDRCFICESVQTDKFNLTL